MAKTIFPEAVQHVRLSDLDREGWLTARRGGIGGSDAAAILGMNPHSSAFAVYMDKHYPAEEQEDNLAMRVGRELEDMVARLWCEETGKEVRKLGFMYHHKDRPWQLANIDRGVVGENAGLECKTTSSVGNIRTLQSGDFPDTYYGQCVHYMAVTGADRWYLAVLEVGFSKVFHTFVIERDDEEVAALVEAERKFWFDNVLTRTPPMPDGSDSAAEGLKKLHPQATDSMTVPLFGMEHLMVEYAGIGTKIKALEKQQAAIAQQLQAQLGDHEAGIAQGWTVKWKNVAGRTTIDAKKLQAAFPAAYECCSKVGKPSRRFEIKEDKQ